MYCIEHIPKEQIYASHEQLWWSRRKAAESISRFIRKHRVANNPKQNSFKDANKAKNTIQQSKTDKQEMIRTQRNMDIEDNWTAWYDRLAKNTLRNDDLDAGLNVRSTRSLCVTRKWSKVHTLEVNLVPWLDTISLGRP